MVRHLDLKVHSSEHCLDVRVGRRDQLSVDPESAVVKLREVVPKLLTRILNRHHSTNTLLNLVLFGNAVHYRQSLHGGYVWCEVMIEPTPPGIASTPRHEYACAGIAATARTINAPTSARSDATYFIYAPFP